MNGDIGLRGILIYEMINREGDGGKYSEKENFARFAYFAYSAHFLQVLHNLAILHIFHILHILQIVHILHFLHNQISFVISFPKTYHIIGLSVVLVFVIVFSRPGLLRIILRILLSSPLQKFITS